MRTSSGDYASLRNEELMAAHAAPSLIERSRHLQRALQYAGMANDDEVAETRIPVFSRMVSRGLERART